MCVLVSVVFSLIMNSAVCTCGLLVKGHSKTPPLLLLLCTHRYFSHTPTHLHPQIHPDTPTPHCSKVQKGYLNINSLGAFHVSVLAWLPTYLVCHGVCAYLVTHLPGLLQGVCAYLVTHLPGLSQWACAYLATHLPGLSQGVCLPGYPLTWFIMVPVLAWLTSYLV